jgi:hypothetical protein
MHSFEAAVSRRIWRPKSPNLACSGLFPGQRSFLLAGMWAFLVAVGLWHSCFSIKSVF